MIIYVAMLTASLSLLVLALVYSADLWEREPVALIQNAFLAGLGVQLVLVLGAHRLAGVETWSGWLNVLTVAALAVVLPILLADEKEVDERFDDPHSGLSERYKRYQNIFFYLVERHGVNARRTFFGRSFAGATALESLAAA